MGRVYLADDVNLGRPVALKALAPHFTGDSSYRERLRREARAAAGMTHPGICTVHALEEFDGQLFIVSELVEGHTLRDEIGKGQPPDVDAIARTARELADALAAAHASGITHRDFKPENVMRDRSGRLKVLDFGLAYAADSGVLKAGALATMPGVLVGTPAYMAPEQLNGERADARADVFAYGVVVYEYACGTHPFNASTPLGLVARVLESDAPPIAERVHHMPAHVAMVIDRCLRKSAADRFGSATEIVAALQAGDAGVSRPSAGRHRAVVAGAPGGVDGSLSRRGGARVVHQGDGSRAADAVGVHRTGDRRGGWRHCPGPSVVHVGVQSAATEGRAHARETDIDLCGPADCRGPGRSTACGSRRSTRCGASSPSASGPASPSRRF